VIVGLDEAIVVLATPVLRNPFCFRHFERRDKSSAHSLTKKAGFLTLLEMTKQTPCFPIINGQSSILKLPAASRGECSALRQCFTATVRKFIGFKIRSLTLQSRLGGTGNALAVAVQSQDVGFEIVERRRRKDQGVDPVQEPPVSRKDLS